MTGFQGLDSHCDAGRGMKEVITTLQETVSKARAAAAELEAGGASPQLCMMQASQQICMCKCLHGAVQSMSCV